MSRESKASDLSEIPDAIGMAIVCVLSGESTDEQYAAVQAWRMSDERHDATFQAVRTVWRQAQPAAARWDVERARIAVHSAIHNAERVAERVPDGRPVVQRRQTWPQKGGSLVRWVGTGLATAAVLCLGVIAVSRHLGPSVRAADTIFTTTSGQRETITLADGSQVTLAPQSRLTVAAAFGQRARRVTLDGEAYFSVQPASNIPFVVRTGAISTRVLGTTFDIRHYADDYTTQVAVFSGRVVTGSQDKVAVLAAGAVGQVTDSSIVVSTPQDSERFMAWRQGRLVFHDTPVPVMLATLGRWYGYDFHLTDTTLAAHHVSVTFRTDQPDESMQLIQVILGVTMRVDGHVITLQPTHTHRPASPRDPRHDVLSPSALEVGK